MIDYDYVYARYANTKVCPILSIGNIKFDGTVAHCVKENCVWYAKCFKDEPQKDLLVTEYPQDGEVNLIGRDKTKAVVMAYDVYKELTEPQYDVDKGTIRCDNCSENGSYKCTKCDGEMYFKRFEDEPQTDCSWKKGE